MPNPTAVREGLRERTSVSTVSVMSSNGSAACRDSDPGMEEVTDAHVERHPRKIKKRSRAVSGKEQADLIEIVQGLQPPRLLVHPERKVDDGLVQSRVQALIERHADAHEDPIAEEIEDALKGVEDADEYRETDERRNASARQNPVVNLQHEKGAGEVEKIDDGAHHRDA